MLAAASAAGPSSSPRVGAVVRRRTAQTVVERRPLGAASRRKVYVPDHFTSTLARAALLSTSSSSFRRNTDIPLHPLRTTLSLRYVSTEVHRPSAEAAPPPPPFPTTPEQTTASPPTPVPLPGTPPPAPPAPLNAIPPKAADLAEKEVEAAVAKKEEKKGSLGVRVWAKVKHELAHYWAGTKLLGQEIKISGKLQWKVLNGGTLTRRERRQLKRTTTDLLRLIPFSVFIIVPFMEFLLPVALRLFPNMLPSTFEGDLAAVRSSLCKPDRAYKQAEKQRKLLRVRIEMAKFLQETVRESGLKAESVVKSDEFKQFFRKVRTTGEKPTQSDVIRVAKLFHDDITLDNLSRPSIVSMCKYLNINALGTDGFLKHQIRAKLERVRVDDMMIHAEGVDSLTTKELQQACQSRGIRFQGVSPAKLREELDQWIELHYTNGISGVLLVLSRAFNFEHQGDDIFASLITTLSSLPENLLNEAELGVSEGASYKQKLEVLQEQQELIEDEAEQEQEEAEARKAEEAAKKEQEEAVKAAQAATEPAEPVKAEKKEEVSKAEEDAKMTEEQLGELAEALNILTAKSSIVKERDELRAVLEDNLLSEAESKERPDEADQKVIAVSKRVRSMLTKIDAQLKQYDEKVGSSLHTIQSNEKGQITLADLKRALRVIKHAPPEEVIEGLGKKLDVDKDGLVELDHVLDLVQDEDLGIGMEDDAAKSILDGGKDIRHSKDLKNLKPKREDIISE